MERLEISSEWTGPYRRFEWVRFESEGGLMETGFGSLHCGKHIFPLIGDSRRPTCNLFFESG